MNYHCQSCTRPSDCEAERICLARFDADKHKIASRELRRMAAQVGDLLCVSPTTNEKLGIWHVTGNTIYLGTQDKSEIWRLEHMMVESSEIELRRSKLSEDGATMIETLESERNRYKEALTRILADGDRPMSMRSASPSTIAREALNTKTVITKPHQP